MSAEESLLTPTAATLSQDPNLPALSPIVPRGLWGIVAAALILLPLSSAVSAVLYLISAGWFLAWRRKHRMPPLPVNARLGYTILAAVAVSAAFSITPALSFAGLLLTGGYLLVIWVTAGTLDTPDRLWQALRLIFWGAVIWAALGIVISLSQFQWTYHSAGVLITLGTGDHRANSIFMHPNILAGYLLLCLGIGLALRTRAGFGRRMRYNAGLIVILLCQLLTQSRSGWIGTVVILLLAGALIDRKILVKSVLALGVGMLFFYNMIWSRLITLTNSEFGSNLNRTRVWHSAQQMIAERPLFGFGPGSWTHVYPQFRNPLEWENLQNAHSFYLHMGAEYGLIVLVLLLVLTLGLVWKTLRETKGHAQWEAAAVVMACSLAGYLVMGIFEFTFSEGRNSIIFFIQLGMLVAMQQRVITEKSAESPATTC
ncbi:O-Antigen ligase [compost metagenome]